jgi:hypothetical protein
MTEPLPGEIGPQSVPEDPDPGFKHIDVRLPKPTYVALGKIAQLLRGDSDDEHVAEFILRAVEEYIPGLLERVQAVQSAKSLSSVYVDAPPRS